MLKFLLEPIVLTASAYILVIFARYQRDRDLLKMLPHLFEIKLLLTLLAIFLLTSFAKALLAL